MNERWKSFRNNVQGWSPTENSFEASNWSWNLWIMLFFLIIIKTPWWKSKKKKKTYESFSSLTNHSDNELWSIIFFKSRSPHIELHWITLHIGTRGDIYSEDQITYSTLNRWYSWTFFFLFLFLEGGGVGLWCKRSKYRTKTIGKSRQNTLCIREN